MFDCRGAELWLQCCCFIALQNVRHTFKAETPSSASSPHPGMCGMLHKLKDVQSAAAAVQPQSCTAGHCRLTAVQEILGSWSRHAPAANVSSDAAREMRAAVQEHFELIEASEDEAQMEEGAEHKSEEGKLSPRIYPQA